MKIISNIMLRIAFGCAGAGSVVAYASYHGIDLGLGQAWTWIAAFVLFIVGSTILEGLSERQAS